MARDGSGNFTRVVTPPVNGDIADADDYNAEQDDVASALSDSINKNGTKAFAADQSMGGFKLTNVGNPSANDDAANKGWVNGLIGSTVQGYDATLTALAALSWVSGNALLQVTAADTVSLTLTPSVSSITASQGAAATTPTATLTNTTDNASVRVLRLGGHRSTAGAAADEGYVSYFLANASSTDIEYARDVFRISSAVNGAEYGQRRFHVMSNGALTYMLALAASSTGTHILQPATNDLVQLGSATVSFADLFLASGAVINWNNGAFTLTEASGVLTASGGVRAPFAASGHTTGTLDATDANTFIIATGNITLPASVFSARQWQGIAGNGTARTITRGSGLTMYVNGVDSATATLTANGVMTVIWISATVCVLVGDVS